MATTALTPAASAYRSGLYEWLTTTDHKKIGILYIVNSSLFFLIAGLLAMGVRTELAFPVLAGFGNYVVPLQIGAPDMAFPRINAPSFWLLPLGGILMFSGFLTGGAAAAGWTSYSPLAQDRPLGMQGSGEDLWITGLIL